MTFTYDNRQRLGGLRFHPKFPNLNLHAARRSLSGLLVRIVGRVVGARRRLLEYVVAIGRVAVP